ncbi:hypothetical protein DNTS_014390, partial [Danionella cerebrum]
AEKGPDTLNYHTGRDEEGRLPWSRRSARSPGYIEHLRSSATGTCHTVLETLCSPALHVDLSITDPGVQKTLKALGAAVQSGTRRLNSTIQLIGTVFAVWVAITIFTLLSTLVFIRVVLAVTLIVTQMSEQHTLLPVSAQHRAERATERFITDRRLFSVIDLHYVSFF